MMRQFLKGAVLAMPLALAGLAGEAKADLPEYLAYTPGTVYQKLIAALPTLGMTATPVVNQGGTQNFEQMSIVKGQYLVASVQYQADITHGARVLRVMTAGGDLIAEFKETQRPCRFEYSAGLCRTLSQTTALQPDLYGDPAFSLTDSPMGGIEYWRYGKRTNVSVWRFEWEDSFAWLQETLKASVAGKPLIFKTALDQALYAMSVDPSIAPWLANVTFTRAGRAVIVAGQVPSTPVHNLIILKLINLGITGISDQLVINTALYPRPWNYNPVPPPRP